MTFLESLKKNRLQLVVLMVLLCGIYWKIVPAMVRDWMHDENYSHGFLVPIISGYFIWQRWPDLKERLARPDLLGLAVLALGLLQLLLGWLATEYFTMRSSLIVLLAGSVLYFFGRQVAKGMALPLAYLLFMVPIPYIIYNAVAFPLKMFVTKVSVAALHLLGVIVEREGNIIIFPNVTFEVADACSGIRSLLSLVALAVAYACFINTTPARRWVLAISAVPIAVATNALRVIVTGVLAQWWGAKAAEGFFHEFAGMAVFVMAMALMVGVGAVLKGRTSDVGRQTSDHAEGGTSDLGHRTPEQSKHGVQCQKSEVLSPKSLVVFVPLIVMALFVNLHVNISVPINRPFSQFPEQIGEWRKTSQQEFSANIIKVLMPTDYLSRQYLGSDGAEVDLYVGYHDGGPESGGIHSPRHCLPGSGWHEIFTRRGRLDTPVGPLEVVRAEYRKGEQRQLFIYWFQMMERSITDEYSLKLMEIRNSILHRRKDQAFIRFSASLGTDEQKSTARLEQFVRDVAPVLREFLPK